jgi:polysaccharide export outer membrane protein
MTALVLAAFLSVVTSQARQDIEYVIGAGDVLTVTVFGQDAHSGPAAVRPDGKISRSLIGEVEVAGLTTTECRDLLVKAYARFFKDPSVLVAVNQINSRRVTISGLVAKPGDYRLERPMDILQLITKAGGLLSQADRQNIRIVRKNLDGKVETIVFNLSKLFAEKGVHSVPQLKSGDQVIVK